MNRQQYLGLPGVQDFLAWMTPFVTGEREFAHSWHSPKFGAFECTGLLDAFARYRWPYRVLIPGESAMRVGDDFASGLEVLEILSHQLRATSRDRKVDRFRDGALAVFKWGGVVGRNSAWLDDQDDAGIYAVMEATSRLDPVRAHLDRLDGIPRLNAGFTKIYSLMLDGFPIYDSRVAAALAYFVAEWGSDRKYSSLPSELRLNLPPHKSTANRVPPTYRFPGIAGGDVGVRQFARSNIRAGWILQELAGPGTFGQVSPSRGFRALEAALFMIGFDLPGELTLAR